MAWVGRGVVVGVVAVAGVGVAVAGWLAWERWGWGTVDAGTTAVRVAAELDRLCLRTAPEALRAALGDTGRYRSAAGETVEGELLVRDLDLSRTLRRDVLVGAAPTRCRLVLPDGTDLLDAAAEAAAAETGAELVRTVRADDGRVARVFRKPEWERPESYLEMQVGLLAEAGERALTLGIYPHDRRRRVERVTASGVRWGTADIRGEGGREVAVAALVVDGHELLVAARGRQAELVFRPAFYPFWPGDGFFGAVGGLLIDGELPSAYRACVEGGVVCDKDTRRMRVPLDRPTLERMLAGRTIRIDTRTTLGERVLFDLPLAGLEAALAAAMERNLGRASELLVRAARAGDPNGVRRALVDGADPNASGPGRVAVLMQAARAGEERATVLELLIEAGARPSDTDERGWTALHHAVDRLGDDPAGMEPLLAAGADPGALAEDGTTPLMVASVRLAPRTVARLIAAGARADARREDGRAAADFAAVARDWDARREPERPPFDVPADPGLRARVLDPWLAERSSRAEAVLKALGGR